MGLCWTGLIILTIKAPVTTAADDTSNFLKLFFGGNNAWYGKCPKISNTLFPTILAKILLLMHLFLKILSGMANSVDPDQTALSGAV